MASAEAQAFFDRLATQPSVARKAAYDTLISGLVYSGVWAKLDALYVFAAADAATAKINLKSSSFEIALVGSPTFAADAGYTGDNTVNTYLNTTFDPTVGTPNFAQNSATIFAWKNTNPAVDNGSLAGINGGNTMVVAYRADGIFYGSAAGGMNFQAGFASKTGMYEATRISATHAKLFFNGLLVTNDSANGTVALVASRPLKFLAEDFGGGCAAQVSAGGFGSGLTDADSRNLNAYVTNYLTEIAGGDRPLQLLFSSTLVNDGLANVAPGIARLNDGRLIAVYGVGVGGHPDSFVAYQTSADDGRTWSAATTIISPAADRQYVDCSVGVDPDTGTIFVTVMYQNHAITTCLVKIQRGIVAGDLSISWAEIAVDGANFNSSSSPVSKLADNRLMLPVYGFPAASITAFFSTDDGLTWGDEAVIATVDFIGDSITEFNFVQLANGTLFGIFRCDHVSDTSRVGYWSTFSTDNAATWSEPIKIFDNTLANAPSRPTLALTPSGNIFFVSRFNGSDDNQTAYSYSTDEGVTWSPPVLYYNIDAETFGQHANGQVFWDTTTQTAMYVVAVGGFAIAQVVFQQFYLPGAEAVGVSSGDDVQVVMPGTVGAIACHVVHTGGTAVQVVVLSAIKVSIGISGGTAIKVTI